KVAAIVGPTAVGKTAASLRVAEELGAEIVSVDSMQIYRGMDVGTAKPARSEMEGVPHHLVDLRDADHELTVAEYQELGRTAIADITARGRLPLLVGGSGLYFRAIVDDLRFPPRSAEVRRELEEEAEELGPAALHARLTEADPDAAARIEPGNVRRIVRALEVIAITGGRFSDNVTWDSYESRYDLAVAGLERERGDLHRRIERRAGAMLAAGLIDEAEEVRRNGAGRTAAQAVGYRQVLEGGGADEIARATRRLARRQLAWFKADPRVRWFDAAAPAVEDALVAYFREALALPSMP
ncbi:MAG TPA: tRNA (adenosine(37)-N6)-dimethylallyltransferase MiaA, partial [Actinomycetota bacterium]|nr:tRNA (adenosine(37)-N6)-dimethylallyltransferase MiaA [Actinomycetota bacterium]